MDSEIKESLSKEFIDSLESSHRLLASSPFVRIVTHYDADGICSSAVLAHALSRANVRFHVTFCKNLDNTFMEELIMEKCECVVFLDIGGNNPDAMEELATSGAKIVIFDHHRVQDWKDVLNLTLVNCNNFGVDGMADACSSTIAFLVALMFSEDNWDLIGYCLAGCIGDKQHLPEFLGINRTIVNVGKSRGVLEERQELNLVGETVIEALTSSIEPIFIDFLTDKGSLKAFLESLHLDPQQKMFEIDAGLSVKLRSALVLKLVRQKVSP
jgi:single-stranded-DNA-specific exonuclease